MNEITDAKSKIIEKMEEYGLMSQLRAQLRKNIF